MVCFYAEWVSLSIYIWATGVFYLNVTMNKCPASLDPYGAGRVDPKCFCAFILNIEVHSWKRQWIDIRATSPWFLLQFVQRAEQSELIWKTGKTRAYWRNHPVWELPIAAARLYLSISFTSAAQDMGFMFLSYKRHIYKLPRKWIKH